MKTRNPAWWQLYLFAPLTLGLLLWLQSAHLAAMWEKVGDLGLVVLTFGGMLVWVRSNETGLDRYEREREDASHPLEITVYEPAGEPEADPTVRHVLKFLEASRRSAGFDGNLTTGMEQEEDEEKWLPN